MSNYLQAGGDTCPAGPLDDADSLLNLPRRCGRRRTPSRLPSSPNLPDVVIGGVSLLLLLPLPLNLHSANRPLMWPKHRLPTVLLIPVFILPVILILLVMHSFHHIPSMKSDAARRFFPPAPRALQFR